MILDVIKPITSHGIAMIAIRAPNARARKPDRIASSERGFVRTIAAPRSRITKPAMIIKIENSASAIDSLTPTSREIWAANWAKRVSN